MNLAAIFIAGFAAGIAVYRLYLIIQISKVTMTVCDLCQWHCYKKSAACSGSLVSYFLVVGADGVDGAFGDRKTDYLLAMTVDDAIDGPGKKE